MALILCLLLLFPWIGSGDDSLPRRSLTLKGLWQFRQDSSPAQTWKSVSVPSTFQSHEGQNFHGIGWYRREIPVFDLPPSHRVLLQFTAAATFAEVWWNGEKLGSHLGGWTPFRFDVTDLVRKSDPAKPHEIRVRLDEKIGHNTQGFLPVIQPHFGGLWQDVQLLFVSETYIDDLGLQTYGNPQTQQMEIVFDLEGGTSPRNDREVSIRLRPRGADSWGNRSSKKISESNRSVKTTIPVEEVQTWSPKKPSLYEVEIGLVENGRMIDRVQCLAGFREIRAQGNHLSLQGKPLSVRGILNWGYYPTNLAPYPDETRFRRDIELARSWGFNTMKFCLWIPPKRFLELCDELGMLAWMEYPTWHPQLTPEHLEELRREFIEFFHYDRNHPSVILRSLTCETGPGADLAVIQQLYDLAHQHIPGAVVEDDSSWIGWNRVHDFYDDHPYGNNHTWVKTLEGFQEHILAHGPKPLVLGECMAADTWFDQRPLLDRLGANRPYWLPGFFDAMQEWLKRLEPRTSPETLTQLVPDSLNYAMLMRKFQVETLRREIPYAGYVISVLRDFPLATMGLLDYFDQPKWEPFAWSWQADTMVLLQTDNDRRCFFESESFHANIIVSHMGAAKIPDAQLTVEIQDPTNTRQTVTRASPEAISLKAGAWIRALELNCRLPSTAQPRRLLVKATLQAPGLAYTNSWPIWIVPRPLDGWTRGVRLHPSVPEGLARQLFSELPPQKQPRKDDLVVATRFDDTLAGWLEQGGRVLLLPDGQTNSLPLSSHWFLRGAPVVANHSLGNCVPRPFWIELQHFDLADRVIPNPGYLDEIDPALLLWDTHDLKTVKTHALLFDTRVGKGRLLVSALRHGPLDNAAGQWLLSELLHHLAHGPQPRNGWSNDSWSRLKAKLHEQKIDLTQRPWLFKPDPRDEGVREGWASPGLALDDTWKDIRVGQHWESQGYPALDHWAWYRLNVQVPQEWKAQSIYLNFEGVDDLYELYLDGQLVTRRGDIEKRIDTFNERFSHDLTGKVQPGQTHTLALRVYDWYGAGGIFRPVSLSTTGFSDKPDILR
ncbi:MAG TPA: glycoside hydrolase family 2 TIM barrel-domain containing protein [Candidatus Paceibacterota bacterium]|nr:glycoside hydrolase family 2 TIM barrel-domain containing protein [Verrucomicrobiota bacterium]HRY50346.1 glycoside hydrolase family 2 TIM barrel-domain containing protein [Candidatus Paceibacterota bacterium]